MPSFYSQSADYKRFRKWVALRKVVVEQQSKKVWRYYEYGPKEATPLILLHGASGTAEVFYKQLLSLCPKGYHLISVQYPGYNTYERWLKAFDKFLDTFKASKVHIFGTSLGGYLAQCYAQYRPNRVLSLILCNTFADTQFYANSHPFSSLFSITPAFLLKRLLLANFPDYEVETEIANSVDFMVEQLESVPQEDLGARLQLNCTVGPLVPADLPLDPSKMTLIDCMDDVALPEKLREEVFKFYPNARQALLKTGGNFPYLSRDDEINMHIEVHLRSLNYQLEKTTDQLIPDDVNEKAEKEETDSEGEKTAAKGEMSKEETKN